MCKRFEIHRGFPAGTNHYDYYLFQSSICLGREDSIAKIRTLAREHWGKNQTWRGRNRLGGFHDR